MNDLISRQAAIDVIRKIKEISGTSDEEIPLIDKAEAMTELIMMPPAQPEVTAEMVDSYVKPRHLRVISEEFYMHLTAGKYLPPPIFQPTQPERTWTPCDIPPEHHKDVIVRGIEAIGNIAVYKVMQWDVDTWRPKDYAPSIKWLDWSEI